MEGNLQAWREIMSQDKIESDKKEAQEIAGNLALKEIDRVREELKVDERLRLGHVSPLVRGAHITGWDRGFRAAVAMFMGASSPEANPVSSEDPADPAPQSPPPQETPAST